MNTPDDTKTSGGDMLAVLDNGAGGGAAETPEAFDLESNAEGWREVEMNATPARIPADWQIKTLDDLTTELPKSRMPAGAATADGKVPFFCSSQAPKRTDEALLDGEAVMLGTGGVATVHHGCGRLAWSTDTWALAPTDDTCGKWLYETLAAGRERIDQTAFNGSGLRHLDKHAMRAWRIACPPKAEQTRIAGILAWQEAQIEDLRKVRKVEQKRLTWLVDELLSGRVRVAKRAGGAPTIVERGGDGVATETLGAFDLAANADGWRTVNANGSACRVPRSWNSVRLGDGFDILGGGTPSTQEPSYWGGDIVWTGPKYMGDDRRYIDVGHPENRRLTPSGAAKVSDRITPAGSLIVSSRAPVGYANIAPCDLYTNQGCYSLVANGTTSPGYVYWWIRSNRSILEASASGTTFMEISRRKLGGIEMAAPALHEQNLVASVLDGQERQVSDLDALIVIEQNRLAWLANELLSGRIRVVENVA